jgi:D-alanyl-D-alanine carboxypeptidase
MSCSTCYPNTHYAWLTEYSGKDEEEIVYAAGELACTVCFPSAPTEVLTRIGEIRRPSDLEREQRAADKAAKNAKRAAAAVIDPNTGKTLYKTDRC